MSTNTFIFHFLFRLLVLLIFSEVAMAQESQLDSYHPTASDNSFQKDSIRFKHFTKDEGLSQLTINDLIQDRFGFVWIATQDGLNRFDGEKFKHYKPIEGDSTTISGRYVVKLFQDDAENIWVGTTAKGLCYYDSSLEKFRRVTLDSSQGHMEVIMDIKQDRSGNMWVASGVSGLFRLKLQNNKEIIQKKIFESKHSISALYANDKDDLWVGNWEGKIYRFNNLNDETPIKSMEAEVRGAVRSFLRIEDRLLIGTDFGFYVYDLASKKVQRIELGLTINTEKVLIKEFLSNDDGTVWISTGDGLILFSLKTKEVIGKIGNATDLKSGLSSGRVHSLLPLSDNKLLVGTANGLDQLDFNEPVFKSISQNNLGKHLLNTNVVFSVLKDKNDLWVGTSHGGLNLIRDNESYYFKEDENDPKSITSNVIRSIVKDTVNNRLWIGTPGGLSMLDLNVFTVEKPEFRVFRFDENNPNSINENFIRDLALDKNNYLWGATFSKGVFRLEMSSNEEDVKIIRYAHQRDDPNSISDNITSSIKVDASNNIWIGSTSGLTKIEFEDYNNLTFLNYSKSNTEGSSLSHNSVCDILVDEEENVWVGTRDGFNLFLGENRFKSWGRQEQFPDAYINSIQDDGLGNLWLGTNDGLIRFNKKTEQFARYSKEDGIQSNEFNIHSKFRDSNGQIYMNGVGGVTYFDPNEIAQIDREKPLYFDQLKIKKEVITPENADGSVLNKTLLKTTRLDLSHNQFPFYLNFSTINFEFNKNTRYAYRLLGQDNEWNFLENKEIQFLNLSPGEYTLQVNGFFRGNEWEQKPLEMILNISPPWFKTWQAYLLYALSLIALVYLVIQWRSRELKKKNESLEKTITQRTLEIQHKNEVLKHQTEKLIELNEAKTRLYSNITHEFRTPLTVILGMADTLKSNARNKTFLDTEKSLEMIRRNGKSLLHMVNELLDLSKVESGSMELDLVQTDVIPFIKYFSESFHSLAETKHINLVVYSEIDSLEMDIDVNKAATIVSNLLSNAIKFTPENGKIIVHLNKLETKESLVIKVQDNGVGLAAEDVSQLFDRFYQGANSSALQQLGTGIGLSLVKEFVDLMKGDISVESTLGKGTTFTVQIPISNNAAKSKERKITAESSSNIAPPEYKKELSLEEDAPGLPLVLIMEDNVDVAHYLETCLKDKYQTMHALNGEEGIKMAFENIPDVIISDVMMPKKNGYEVCAILKEDERTDHIPIILLTAKVTTEDRLIGLTHGADAYLAKPFNQDELYTRLDQLILVRKKLINKLEQNGFSSVLGEKFENPQTKFVQQVIKIVLSHLDNANFGPTLLAEEMRLSESQIYRKLKSITDKSTAIFIRSVRLQKAKELLKTSNKSVSEIAYEVGFNDPSWFSRSFKEEFGFSPSKSSK